MNLVKSKVVLLPCREYDEEKIYMLLKQGLDFRGWSGDSDSKGCEDPAEAESARKKQR